MEKKFYSLKRIGPNEKPAIKELFLSVFTAPPWNDDWSDENQLEAYLADMIGQNNSLTYGLYDGDELIGISMGHLKHWFSGTEYCLNEFCITPERQGNGIGSYFFGRVERLLREGGVKYIFAETERNVPAYPFYRKHGFQELSDHVTFVKPLL